MLCVFRADASGQIGSGHVMRCLTLAKALRARGAQCRFLCREHPGHLLEVIRRDGFDAIALPVVPALATDNAQCPAHAAWLGCSWREDAAATAAVLSEVRADWLVMDHYALDARWETSLQAHYRHLMVIDDLADRRHECALLLDQNAVADTATRYRDRVPASCRSLLGTDFALLQPLYAQMRPTVLPRGGAVRRVLIYFGGADDCNLTGMALEALLALEHTGVGADVVLGHAHPYASAIRERAAGHENITLHGSLPSLAPLMLQADLAIGAGGATSWERCCLGLPTLAVSLADNQIPVAAELHRRGVLRWLGDKSEMTAPRLARELASIIESGLPVAWSQRCLGLVDGLGADRVCDMLEDIGRT